MKEDEAVIILKDTIRKVRTMKEFQEMLTKIDEIADKYGFNLIKVDAGIIIELPGKIHEIDIDLKFS